MSIQTDMEREMVRSHLLIKRCDRVIKYSKEVRAEIDRSNGVPPHHTAAREIFGSVAWNVIKELYTEEELS